MQQTGLETPSPLSIPELLDRILSYLDPYTLGKCAILVSREWNAAGLRHFKPAEYAWSDCLKESEGLDQLLEMLPWMTRLRWLSEPGERDGTEASRKRQWALLLTRLEKVTHTLRLAGRRNDLEEIQSYMDMLSHLPPMPFHSLATSQRKLVTGQGARLREFELGGKVYSDRLMLLLPLLPCLNKLKVLFTLIHGGPLLIARIVRDCPRLEHLYITDASFSLENLPGPWIFTDPNPANSSNVIAPILALKSLILYCMALKQHTLHHFVTFTPYLKELKIVCTKVLDAYAFDFARFNKHIRGQPLQLDYFHFSNYNQPHDGVVSVLCPSPQQRTLASCDLTPTVLKSLRLSANNVTTLELYNRIWQTDCSPMVPPKYSLHEYLCSSPHLLHLKALHCEYSIELMDLHGRLRSLLAHFNVDFYRSKKHRRAASLPGIWACRKLRTLHIRIITPENVPRNEKSCPEMTRIAFGYVARVCPELRDFALGNGSGRSIMRQPPLDLQLQGGFCLLGRLKHLERIEIGRFLNCSTLTPRNFEWMHEFGLTKDKKVERQDFLEKMWKQLGHWTHILESPKIYAATITANRNYGTDEGHFNWRTVAPKLREELKYLGWPVDVQAFFDELDAPAKNGDKDKTPAEIILAIGLFLDGPSLVASVLVCREWHFALEPLVWRTITRRQWHHPYFPVSQPLKTSNVLAVYRNESLESDQKLAPTFFGPVSEAICKLVHLKRLSIDVVCIHSKSYRDDVSLKMYSSIQTFAPAFVRVEDLELFGLWTTGEKVVETYALVGDTVEVMCEISPQKTMDNHMEDKDCPELEFFNLVVAPTTLLWRNDVWKVSLAPYLRNLCNLTTVTIGNVTMEESIEEKGVRLAGGARNIAWMERNNPLCLPPLVT
ncbi:hypothetical protein EC991_000986 [Linnemannia zychae]|nr:hypothetical protein EC991_000986 [Linnemannia zychae]